MRHFNITRFYAISMHMLIPMQDEFSGQKSGLFSSRSSPLYKTDHYWTLGTKPFIAQQSHSTRFLVWSGQLFPPYTHQDFNLAFKKHLIPSDLSTAPDREADRHKRVRSKLDPSSTALINKTPSHRIQRRRDPKKKKSIDKTKTDRRGM